MILELPSWLMPLQAIALVASPRLRLRQRGLRVLKKKKGYKGFNMEAKLWGVVKLGDRMGLVNQVGVVNQGRGSRWGHRNPKTRWLKRVEDCVAFNSLHLFSAYLQTFITPSTR